MGYKPDWKAGIPAGIRYWIYFMIGFALLGYGWVPSIAFGALVAASVMVIAAWWNAKEDVSPDKSALQKDPEEPVTPELPTQRVYFRKTRGLGRLRPIRAPRPFSWLLRRK